MFDFSGVSKVSSNILTQSTPHSLNEDDCAAKFSEHNMQRTGESPFLVGSSPFLENLKKLITRFAKTDMAVLITGESGTGKEVVARMMHVQSARAAATFRAINCGALPCEMVESELFGHEKGAFTGACARRVGQLEESDGSTLLLDEIGELPPAIQVKFLRVLQEKEIQRLGSNRTIKINVRIIAATNCVLAEAIAAGRFRRDLYYRLQGCEVHLQPLREHREDIRALAAHFAGRFSGEQPPAQFTEETLQILEAYWWPGNVRELANTVEYAVNLCTDGLVRAGDLPENLRHNNTISAGQTSEELGPGQQTKRIRIRKWRCGDARIRLERAAVVEEAIKGCDGSVTRAAKELGISRQSVHRIRKDAGH